MNDTLLNLITSKDENWDKRWKYNCAIFIISYIFMGAVTGITNDSFVSYLNITVPDVVKALPAYASIATFAIAIILLFTSKIGYKKIAIGSPIILLLGLFACIYSTNTTVILIANIIINIGVAMYDCIYPLMFTSYTPIEERTSMFSRVMYCNLISQSILTFFNGKIVVWKFSKNLKISYDQAAILSEHQDKLTSMQLSAYTSSYKFVLWIAVILTVISLFFLFFLKEQVQDYQETKEEIAERKSGKKFDFKLLANKYVIMWVVIFSVIRFGALLVTPYFPIYLNDFLHISRGVVSTIITFSTIAMVLGYFCTPWLEKKLGAIVTIAVATILCVPIMFIMPHGAMFGANVSWAIGIILFFRSGIANASGPIELSLPLTFVPKNLVPTYNSLILVTNAVVGIIAGLFGRYVLFTKPSGYGTAYYIAGAVYLLCSIVLLIIFTKKYNRPSNNSEDEANIN